MAVPCEFRWNDWNVHHIGKHGVTPAQAETVVRGARPPFPAKIGHGKYLAIGPTDDGTYLQVIYLIDPDDTIFVIHARPLTATERRRYRRRA